MDELGLSSECNELYHDLESGGAAHICNLHRRHPGPHGKTIVSDDNVSDVDCAAENLKMLQDILHSNGLLSETMPDVCKPPIFMNGG